MDDGISNDTRAIAIDHMIRFHYNNNCSSGIDSRTSDSTLHQAIIIFDKYLSKSHPADLLNVGIMSYFLSNKMEEIYSIELTDISSNFGHKELLEIEYDILQKLNYRLYYETTHQYLKIYLDNNKITLDGYHFTMYVALILFLENTYCNYTPNYLADQLLEFWLVLHMEPKVMEILINGEPVYSYIYLSWLNYDRTKYPAIYDIYSGYSHSQTALRLIPHINTTSSLKKSGLAYSMEIDDASINIYPKDVFEKFVTVSKLGKGAYGQVWSVKNGSKQIALKEGTEYDERIGIPVSAIREINALLLLSHPNITNMDGFYYDPYKISMFIGMDLMDDTLLNRIKRYYLDDETKSSYIMQLLSGISYIHSQNIMHRDLSHNNILVSNNNILKIADFGSARAFRHQDYIIKYTTEVCTIYVRAIEVLLGALPYTAMIDVWSCACLILFIMSRSEIFIGDSEIAMIFSIFKVLGTPTKGFNPEVLEWPEFRSDMPVWQRTGFPYLEEKYPKQIAILYQMLEYVPSKRITTAEALELFSKK